MYCKHCGKEISDDSIFCTFCGTQNLNESNTSETPEPEHIEGQLNQAEINKKLAQYKGITETHICPICGYKGGMGLLKENVAPMYRRIGATLVGAIVGYIASNLLNAGTILSIIIYGLSLFYFEATFKAKKKKYVCPNCDSELVDK